MENLDKNLIKAKKDIREIKMTSDEKAHIFESILNAPTESKISIQSPYNFFSFVSSFSKNRLVYSVSMGCLVIFISTGAVVASGNSLPGNILYPLKVRVVEPARGAFISSPVAKIEYESSLATKRIIEAEALAYEDKLDESKEEQLNSLLESHTTAFSIAVNKFRQSESFDQSIDEDVSTNFEATMNAHARVLEVINEDKNTGKENKRNIKISKTARDSAIKIRNTKDDNEYTEDERDQAPEKYKKRIDDIQSIIDKTTTDIDKNRDEISSSKKKIISDAHKTLEDARKLLKESDEDDKRGDSKNSRSKLLDSERSAREASIFLRAGLEL